MLAYLLQIPREHIAHLTGSSLITALGLPSYNLSRFWVQLTDPDLRSWLHPFMTVTTRVCPYCIREQPGYDRLYWSMHGVQSCPRHNVRLLEKCPACLKPIPVARPLSNWCPFCQRELYVSTTESLPKDNVLTAGTSLFLTMLQIPSSEASDTFKFLSPLLTVTPDRYFGLLIALPRKSVNTMPIHSNGFYNSAINSVKTASLSRWRKMTRMLSTQMCFSFTCSFLTGPSVSSLFSISSMIPFISLYVLLVTSLSDGTGS